MTEGSELEDETHLEKGEKAVNAMGREVGR